MENASNDVPAKLESDRQREWSVVVVDRYTGLSRELRLQARGEGQAELLAHLVMTRDESIDTIREA
jgi:hypothetical protein